MSKIRRVKNSYEKNDKYSRLRFEAVIIVVCLFLCKVFA